MNTFDERRVFDIRFPDSDDEPTHAVEVTVQEANAIKKGKRVILMMKPKDPGLLFHLVQASVFFTLMIALFIFLAGFLMGYHQLGFFALVVMSVLLWPYVS